MADAPVRIEAEDFTGLGESNYRVKSNSDASGGALVRTTSSGPSTLETDLPDTLTPGLYSITIWYYDENDGQSPVSVAVDGATVGSWVLDEATSGAGGQIENLRSITFQNVEIGADSVFSITGERHQGEYARIDAVDFQRTGDVAPPDPEPDTSTPFAAMLPIADSYDPAEAITITVEYGDDTAIDVTTIDTGDVLLNGTISASSFDIVETESGPYSKVIVNYTFDAPEGGFATGSYLAALVDDAVTDQAGNSLGETYGTPDGFTVSNFGPIQILDLYSVGEPYYVWLDIGAGHALPDGAVLTITYETFGTGDAVPGIDFEMVSGTISDDDGDGIIQLGIPILPDTELELDSETFGFRITGATLDGESVPFDASDVTLSITQDKMQFGTPGDDDLRLELRSRVIDISQGGADWVDGYIKRWWDATVIGLDTDDRFTVRWDESFTGLEWDDSAGSLTLTYPTRDATMYFQDLPDLGRPITADDWSVTQQAGQVEVVFAPADGVGLPDVSAPTVEFLPVAELSNPHEPLIIQVRYSDATGVDTSTLDSRDLLLSGVSYASSQVDHVIEPDGSILATYTYTPHRSGFSTGEKQVTFANNEVSDVLGNIAIASQPFSFTIPEYGPELSMRVLRSEEGPGEVILVEVFIREPLPPGTDLYVGVGTRANYDAIPGVDFHPIFKHLVFNSEIASHIIEIPVLDDRLIEGEEAAELIVHSATIDGISLTNYQPSVFFVFDAETGQTDTSGDDVISVQSSDERIDLSAGGQDTVQGTLEAFDGLTIVSMAADDIIELTTAEVATGLQWNHGTTTLTVSFGDPAQSPIEIYLETLPDLGRDLTTDDFRLTSDVNGVSIALSVPGDDPVDPPNDPDLVPVTIEAEDFTGLADSEFRVQYTDNASGGALVRSYSGQMEALTTDLTGVVAPGNYKMVVTYFDENDGYSTGSAQLDDRFLGTWVFDEETEGGGVQTGNIRTETFELVQVQEGSILTLSSNRSQNEYGRIDKVEFIPLDPGVDTGDTTGPTIEFTQTILPTTPDEKLHLIFTLSDGQGIVVPTLYGLDIVVTDSSGQEADWLSWGVPNEVLNTMELFARFTPPPGGWSDGPLTVTFPSGAFEDSNGFGSLETTLTATLDVTSDRTDPPTETPETLVIEAEDIIDVGYSVQQTENASGGALVRTGGSGVLKTELGEDFEAGLYSITIYYFDENDGQSFSRLSVDDVQLGSWTFDDDGPGAGVQAENIRTHTFENVSLSAGAELVIRSNRNDNEYARIDKIVITPMAPPAETAESEDAFDFSAIPAAVETEYEADIRLAELQQPGMPQPTEPAYALTDDMMSATMVDDTWADTDDGFGLGFG